MRRRRAPCLALGLALGLAAPAAAGDLSGIWFAEYGEGGDRVQEVTQRLDGGRWRAEIRVFEACRETQRFMVEGRWTLDGGVLTHVMQRRGSYFVSPRPIAYTVLDVAEDALRLRDQDGGLVEVVRVPRSFRPPAPSCGPQQRG